MKNNKKKRTTWNYDWRKEKMEVNSGELVTIPGDSLSIKELLERHSRGIANLTGQIPQYSDTEDEFNTDPTLDPEFDLTDVTRIKEEISLNEKFRREAEAKFEAEARTKNEDKARAENETKS